MGTVHNLYQNKLQYPAWLEENDAELSEEDRKNYSKQQECFKRIITAFECVPEDKDEVLFPVL